MIHTVLEIWASPLGSTATTEEFGKLAEEYFQFSHIFGALIPLLALWAVLWAYGRLVDHARRWQLGIAHSLDAWSPTVRLLVGGLMILVVVDALTPDIPEARAVVVVGMVAAVLWSAQAVLRNAAAGAVIIARRAVQVGEHLRVGEYAGQVVAVTLRGVEIESGDGTRTFIPGILLHTESIHQGPLAGRTAATRFDWALPHDAGLNEVEELRRTIHRMSLLSPRRAPGTPVLVQIEPDARAAHITVTPYVASESDALRLELTKRFKEAIREEDSPPH